MLYGINPGVSSFSPLTLMRQLNFDVGVLNISQLRDVKFGLRGFKNLVLDSKYKTIVQALVKSYVEKKSDFKDLVDGKGKGLVALLHGAPGTGKTLTPGIPYGFPLSLWQKN